MITRKEIFKILRDKGISPGDNANVCFDLYRRRGLLMEGIRDPQNKSVYLYPDEIIERLIFIRMKLQEGLTLAQIEVGMKSLIKKEEIEKDKRLFQALGVKYKKQSYRYDIQSGEENPTIYIAERNKVLCLLVEDFNINNPPEKINVLKRVEIKGKFNLNLWRDYSKVLGQYYK